MSEELTIEEKIKRIEAGERPAFREDLKGIDQLTYIVELFDILIHLIRKEQEERTMVANDNSL